MRQRGRGGQQLGTRVAWRSGSLSPRLSSRRGGRSAEAILGSDHVPAPVGDRWSAQRAVADHRSDGAAGRAPRRRLHTLMLQRGAGRGRYIKAVVSGEKPSRPGARRPWAPDNRVCPAGTAAPTTVLIRSRRGTQAPVTRQRAPYASRTSRPSCQWSTQLSDAVVGGAVAAATAGVGGRAGRPGVKSHWSNNVSSCIPDTCSASATNSGVVAFPPAFWSAHERRMAKNFASPTVHAQRLQRHRAAFVHRVVEQVRRARVADRELPERIVGREPQVVVEERLLHCRRALVLGPQPLRVRREAFVEPHVLPPPQRDVVAEPLVGELVDDHRVAQADAEEDGIVERSGLVLERETDVRDRRRCRRRPRTGTDRANCAARKSMISDSRASDESARLPSFGSTASMMRNPSSRRSRMSHAPMAIVAR